MKFVDDDDDKKMFCHKTSASHLPLIGHMFDFRSVAGTQQPQPSWLHLCASVTMQYICGTYQIAATPAAVRVTESLTISKGNLPPGI